MSLKGLVESHYGDIISKCWEGQVDFFVWGVLQFSNCEYTLYIFFKQFVTLPVCNVNTPSCKYFNAISQLQLSKYLDSRVNGISGHTEV